MATEYTRFSEADKIYSSAMHLLASGDPAGAAALLDDIVARFDHYGKAWCELGNLLLYQLNDSDGAITCFKKCMDVMPSYAPAYLGYADALFQQEKYAESNAVINQAMEVRGVRRDLGLQKSALLMESQGRYDEAIKTYIEAILASFSEEEILKCERAINRCQIKKKYS